MCDVILVWHRHLRKVNKSSVRTFRRFFCNQQFTLTTKKSLHITFKALCGPSALAELLVPNLWQTIANILERKLNLKKMTQTVDNYVEAHGHEINRSETKQTNGISPIQWVQTRLDKMLAGPTQSLVDIAIWMATQLSECEWVSSFLTAHQHIIGHSVP